VGRAFRGSVDPDRALLQNASLATLGGAITVFKMGGPRDHRQQNGQEVKPWGKPKKGQNTGKKVVQMQIMGSRKGQVWEREREQSITKGGHRRSGITLSRVVHR